MFSVAAPSSPSLLPFFPHSFPSNGPHRLPSRPLAVSRIYCSPTSSWRLYVFCRCSFLSLPPSLIPSLQMVLTVWTLPLEPPVPSAGRFPDLLFPNVKLEVVCFLSLLLPLVPSFPPSLIPSLQMVLTVWTPPLEPPVPSAGRFPDLLFPNVKLEVVCFLSLLLPLLPSFPPSLIPSLQMVLTFWTALLEPPVPSAGRFPDLLFPNVKLEVVCFLSLLLPLLPSFPPSLIPSLQMVLTVWTSPLEPPVPSACQ